MDKFVPGLYQHYKGGIYIATHLEVWHDGNGEGHPRIFVSYICCYENNPQAKLTERCIRPVEEWGQLVGVRKPVGDFGAKETITVPRYRLLSPIGP